MEKYDCHILRVFCRLALHYSISCFLAVTRFQLLLNSSDQTPIKGKEDTVKSHRAPAPHGLRRFTA